MTAPAAPGARPAPTPQRGRRPSLDALTTLRFLAAFRVLMYHMVQWDEQPPWLRGLMGTPIGVSYFFVASGFLLTYSYADASDHGRLAPYEFWRKRCGRILPVYYLGLLVGIPMLLGQGDLAPGKIAATLLLVQAWNPSTALYWDFPAWALSALAFFYLVMPFALRATARTTPRRLVVLGLATWALSVAVGVAYVIFRPDGLAAVTLHTRAAWLHVIKFNPLVRLPEFLLGMYAGRFFLRRGGFGPNAVRAFWIGVLLLAAALFLAQWLPYPVANSGLMDPLLVVLLVALSTGGPVARALSHRRLVRLGQSSFCLYMVHAPLLYLGWALAPPGWRHAPAYLLALIPTIVLIALALYWWVEAPISAALRRR